MEEQQKKTVSQIEKVILSKPLLVDGKEIAEITLDLGKLTCEDLENVEAELVAEQRFTPVPESSKAFNIRVAARACGITYSDLKRLGAKDASKITMLVSGFLLE